MPSRLHDMFATLRSRGEKAMGLFVTNGFPEPDATLPILRAIDAGGADFIELGLPFSDPLAEGRPIQRSSARALSNGVTMADAFETAAAFRAESDTPLLFMGYLNPLLRYGIDAFCRNARESGVDGLILPDLPPEEDGLLTKAAEAADLDLVYLIAPNTPDDRIQLIDRKASGFVYAVSVTGLTGSDLGAVSSVEGYLQHARQLVERNPLLVGFGIRTHEDAVQLSRPTDGFIVGSALINRIEELWADASLSTEKRLAAVSAFAQTLKYGSDSTNHALGNTRANSGV